MASCEDRHGRAQLGYLVTESSKDLDGVQNLLELDLFEISLTPAPANPETRILSFKSTDPPIDDPESEPLDPEYERMKDQARNEIAALLGARLDPHGALAREKKKEMRDLRRECDRIRLEASLGFDRDLIDRVRT